MGDRSKRKRIWWCIVCGSDEDDELKYGQLCETRNFKVHFFCLLLSSTFEQRGRDSEGVFGFRVKDIERGLELIKDTVCWYCGHPGASIYCAKPGCRRVFHLTCGVQSGCLSQFLDTFDSLCHKHNNEFRYKDYKEDQCVICRDPLKFTCDALQTDCCNSVFHRRCIGSLALSAGYFFKCPLCNNTEAFRKCMRRKGIYVPDRDASWELEANAYNELHAPKYSCEAKVCLSKQGREFNSANGFAFMSCSSCGAGSIHRKCCYTPDFICEICSLLYKSATVKMEDTLDNNTLSESVLFEVLRPVTAPNEVEQDQNTPRRSARQPRAILQRQESPAVSPLKQLLSQRTGRNIRSGGTPKRRRLH